MRNKIVFKLFALFAAVLVVFVVVVGSTFGHLFGKHIIETKKLELEGRAVKIAQALSDGRERFAELEKRRGMLKRQRGTVPYGPMPLPYGAVLRFLGSAAAEDIWIIDENKNLEIPSRPGGQRRKFRYKDLPPEAEETVKKVRTGAVTADYGFSEMLKTPTLTVGAPIRDKDNKVLGVVLIHTPIAGMDAAVNQANKIFLLCVVGALLVAVLAALYFSWLFTKPLKVMQQTAEKMKEGDYRVRCGVKQKDEIGELGSALDSLGERLLEASQESAQLDQLRKDFIANISHELRTPVTVIRGSLEALCDKLVTAEAEVEEYHRQMLSESIFLQRLINDLLDLSRLQNTNFQIEMSQLNLCEVLHDVGRSCQRLAAEKAIKVVVTTDKPVYELCGDYGRLRQMLMIFLDNSLKFSPCENEVSLRLMGDRIEVIDHGAGVSTKDLPHIFDRFYKTRSETNKSGTGLGLTIAREIAERHGMKVHMESEPGVVTKVIVEIGRQEDAI